MAGTKIWGDYAHGLFSRKAHGLPRIISQNFNRAIEGSNYDGLRFHGFPVNIVCLLLKIYATD